MSNYETVRVVALIIMGISMLSLFITAGLGAMHTNIGFMLSQERKYCPTPYLAAIMAFCWIVIMISLIINPN